MLFIFIRIPLPQTIAAMYRMSRSLHIEDRLMTDPIVTRPTAVHDSAEMKGMDGQD